MSKRDTDTEIWSEDWFLNLSDVEMLFWFYIKDKCDHAGFWRPNFKLFENNTGRRVNQREFLEKMNLDKERIKILENGRWFITGFISFQYCGKLNLNNRFHKSVWETFRKNIPEEKSTSYHFEVTLTSIRPQLEVNKEQETKNEKEGGMGETKKFVCPDHLKDLWPDYLITRKNKRAAKTETALKRIVDDLEKFAPGDNEKQREILKKSIDSGWAGVFPLKQGFKSTERPLYEFERNAADKYRNM